MNDPSPRLHGILGAVWRVRLVGGLVLVALGAIGVLRAVGDTAFAPPVFDQVRGAYCPSDARLLDRHGVVLHELRVDTTRRRLAWTPLGEVSPALRAEILASEDRRFFAHTGVDWRAVAAAVWQRVRGGPPRGASTVSMQLAALIDPELRHRGAPRTLHEKWYQMRGAWGLERAWTKAQILEAYLNLVTFRGELQGVGAAAQVLFNKAPHGLTHAESLVLAALVRAPNADRDSLTHRVQLLDRALRQAQGEREIYAQEEPCCVLAGLRLGQPNSVRPELVEGRDRVNFNVEALAIAIDRALDVPRGTGPRVALAPHAARRLMPPIAAAPCVDTPSTLDADVQRYAAESLHRHLLAIRDHSVRDAAVLVADNASGDVLAYVAGSGDLSSARHVDGIQARRQAGSTLKPFLYALALDRGLLTAASLLDDSPLEIASGGGGLFRPRNYDDHFRGLVSLRTALAGSLNVPAVRALLLVGPDAFAAQLRGLGFAGVVEAGDYYGPSLALGSADVTLWQQVNAYRTLANGGAWTPLRMQEEEVNTLRPAHPKAVALRQAQDHRTPTRVVSEAAAFIVSDILADRDSRSVTFGLESPLATRFWSAVKTGTSKDMRDNWCIGSSRRFTVGVWVGNFSGAPMRDVSGISGAAPIWEDVMSWLHRDLPSQPPTPPPGIGAAAVAFADGAEAPRREWFVAGTEPTQSNPVRAHAPRIVVPTDGSIIALDPDIPSARQRVAFEADAAHSDLRWMLDDVDLGPADTLLWPPVRGSHRLRLVDGQARALGEVRFEVRGPAT